MPQMLQVLRERAIGMLTAGMSTRAVARELNVHFSAISHLQRRFREFGSTSNRPHYRRPRVTTPAQGLHILNAQRYRDEILRPIVVPFIHDHHLILQHDNARPHVARIWTCHPLSMFGMLWIGIYTTACSSSCQYPATSHSHWRGVDQHSTGHNQQPEQLYAKEMCRTAWGKWWSHQILTGFRTPPIQ